MVPIESSAQTNSMNNERKPRYIILFNQYESTNKLKLHNVFTRKDIFIDNNLFLEKEIIYVFWDPQNKKNFFFYYPKRGFNVKWFELNIKDGEIILHEQAEVTDQHTPPIVLNSKNNFEINSIVTYKENTTHTQLEIFIKNVSTGEILWNYYTDDPEKIRSTHRVYWINNEWIYPAIKSNNVLQNIITNKYKKISPEIITGYGENVIITSSDKYHGLCVKTLQDKILYNNTDFNVKEPFFAYFDYPFIYITYKVWFEQMRTMYINILDNKITLFDKGYTNFLGIYYPKNISPAESDTLE